MSGFASTTDLAAKTISFEELGSGLYGYTAEGDPNSGIVIGDDSVLVVDAQATPIRAADVIARIRTVTDKPVRHVVLSHYHAVRVLGASGYEGAEIIASDATRELIVERGQQDRESEIGRLPRLFRGKESIPGLTWPDVTFQKKMTLWLGSREVQIIHTAGDTVVWLPQEKVCFAGDTVEFGATPLLRRCAFRRLAGHACGAARARGREADARPWSKPHDAAGGRGRNFRYRCLHRRPVRAGADAMAAMRPNYGHWVIFEHCMPFDVSRAYDEARGLDHPRIWTAERDIEMWAALEQGA